MLRLSKGKAERMVPTLASGTPTASRAPRRAPAPIMPIDQLALFAPSMLHPVIEQLRGTDANTLTPIAALQLLAELAQRARDS